MWIDSHCHLDAPEFEADRLRVRQAARQADVALCVIPSVERANFATVRELAHQTKDVYALGIHPLYVPGARAEDLQLLEQELIRLQDDPRLVAIGEIGLDYFVPQLCTAQMRDQQWYFYTAQLRLAQRYQRPVIVHVRKSVDMLLKGLRQIGFAYGGIAHAFNGSAQQAQALIDLGFKLGFGGTLTYTQALQIRRLASTLPLSSIVLETDAPDIVPQWLYVTAQQRAQGIAAARNTPIELPRIGQCLAQLRGQDVRQIAQQTTQNLKQLFDHFFRNQPLAVHVNHD